MISLRKYRAQLVPRSGDGQLNPFKSTDITEDIAKLYDLVIGSMDWGSGFLDTEDYEAVIKVGILCGFDLPQCDQYYSFPGFVRDHVPDRNGDEIRISGECQKYRTHPGLCEAKAYSVGHEIPVPITFQGRK